MSNQTEDIKNQVIALLSDICGTDAGQLTDHTDLFEEGYLDSLTFVELLVGLDEAFSIPIAPTEVEREQLSTIDRIVHFIQTKKG